MESSDTKIQEGIFSNMNNNEKDNMQIHLKFGNRFTFLTKKPGPTW